MNYPVFYMLDPLAPLPPPHPGLPVPHLPRVGVDHQGRRLCYVPHLGQGWGDMVWVAAVHSNGHDPTRFGNRVFQNHPHSIFYCLSSTEGVAILDGEADPGWKDDRGFGKAVKSCQNLQISMTGEKESLSMRTFGEREGLPQGFLASSPRQEG